MRSHRTIAIALVSFGVMSGHGLTQASQADPLKDARAAVGAVATVRSLQLEGETSSLNLADGTLSDPDALLIKILLPDRYLRTVNNGRVISAAGFAGEELLNGVKALRPNVNVTFAPAPDQIKTERVQFARLLLGMLARTTAAMPLTIQQSANPATLDVTGPDGIDWKMDLDPKTRLPIRVRYQGSVYLPQPGVKLSGPPAPVREEIIVTFGDRRNVGGLQLPFLITTAAKGVTIEQRHLKNISVNPPLGPADFAK